MRRDWRAALADVRKAASAVAEFTQGLSFDDYRNDRMRRSAVERQLEIIAESLARLLRERPDVAVQIPDVSEAIGMRNILIHGYDVVDQALIWKTTQWDVPRLLEAVEKLIAAADE